MTLDFRNPDHRMLLAAIIRRNEVLCEQLWDEAVRAEFPPRPKPEDDPPDDEDDGFDPIVDQ